MAKRTLTNEERRAAAWLKSLIQEKREVDPSFTQVYISTKLGMSQPTLAQYINGIIPLGLDMVLQLADILNVAPEDIYPEKAQKIQRIAHRIKEDILPIMGTVTGNAPEYHQVTVANVALARHCYSVHVDTDALAMYIPEGTYLIVNPLGILRQKHKVVFRYTNSEAYHVGLLQDITPRTLKYICFASGKLMSAPLKDVRSLHAVCGEQYPPV